MCGWFVIDYLRKSFENCHSNLDERNQPIDRLYVPNFTTSKFVTIFIFMKIIYYYYFPRICFSLQEK